jgi:opacity protein-like surface antigen
MRRRWLTVAAMGAAMLFSGRVAQGQTAHGSADGPQSYAGIMAQSAFGNVTSQSFGLEGGYAVSPRVVIFAEGGRVFDAAPSSVGAGAQLIANFLNATHTSVAYTVKEPITFFAVGAKLMVPTSTRFTPYVLAGVGAAQAAPDAEFTINAVNVTQSLSQFGVVLGSDLNGTVTKAMIEGGAGVVWDITDRFYLDFEFRYNRVFTDTAIPFGRAGGGIGVRF